jgi:hypothetical protein
MTTAKRKKTTKNSPSDSLCGYSQMMDKAITKLSTALAYAEDGAQMSAAIVAAEAIPLLLHAKVQREDYLAGIDQEEKA